MMMMMMITSSTTVTQVQLDKSVKNSNIIWQQLLKNKQNNTEVNVQYNPVLLYNSLQFSIKQ
jgi:hypothetical protein